MFTPSTAADIDQITEWAAADPWHHVVNPGWWLTGAEGSFLAFCLMDSKGPVAYVRLEVDDGYVRIHTKFAPESVVSKRRLVVGMIEAVKKLIEFYKQSNAKGLVFQSVSPNLIAFMDKYLGFKQVGNDDYRLEFEGKN